MSRGAKIIILIIVGLAAIGVIFYFIILPIFPKSAAPSANVNANIGAALPLANVNANANANSNINAPLPVEVSPEVQQLSTARSVVRTFAERLDTYTNRNNLVNISDLKTISTSAVWKYLDGEYRSKLIAAMPAGKDFYSVVSTALNVNVSMDLEGEMNAKVGMQRVESGAISKTSYPVLDLKLKKVGEEWLVSWLEWEK